MSTGSGDLKYPPNGQLIATSQNDVWVLLNTEHTHIGQHSATSNLRVYLPELTSQATVLFLSDNSRLE